MILKVLNFGSRNIDFVYSTEHFARAGETASPVKPDRFCGGKGLNQSVALARAGARVYHAGCIGRDGDMLKTYLFKSVVHTDFIHTCNEPGGYAVIQVDAHGQNCIILYGGANQTITTEHIDGLMFFNRFRNEV